MFARIPMAGAVAGALALAVSAAPALAAGSATAAGVASATVVAPLHVVALAPMDFGDITHAEGTSGTVTISPGASQAQFSGGASSACAGSGCANAHAARFSVSGEPERNYTIQLPATIVATGAPSPGSSVPGAGLPALTVNGLTVRSASSATAPRLDAAGSDRFEVGGTITLPSDLPPARYRASFTVIVSYV